MSAYAGRVGMFDWYQPRAIACPRCGAALVEWQGKDGPCALFVYREGDAAPVDQRVDDDARIAVTDRARFALSRSVAIYSYDCEHAPVHAIARVVGGVWVETRLSAPARN